MQIELLVEAAGNDLAWRAINEVMYGIKNASRYISSDDLDPIAQTRDKNGWEFAIRYFGNWVNPPDAEDDEDYDWQVPTDETARKVDSIVKKVAADFPKVKVTWHSGEKNWFYFTAVNK